MTIHKLDAFYFSPTSIAAPRNAAAAAAAAAAAERRPASPESKMMITLLRTATDPEDR